MTPKTSTATPSDLRPVETYTQMIAPDGTLAEGARPRLADDQLLEAFRWMKLSRLFDDRAYRLNRQGRFGTIAATTGQEAVATGVSMALRLDRDWIVPAYRELPALLRHGWPLQNAILYYRGHPDAWRMPDRLINIQIALAAQIPHAVGLAWGLRRRGEDAVVVCFFGDGASSEGDFHEALNFAGVLKVPAIFVLQNNNWAISTPATRQSATTSFAARALGYGIAGAAVDGNDVLAVHAAATAAVERARAGAGPTLIEAKTYRLLAHNTIDEASLYQDPDELGAAERLEPLSRLRAYLRAAGLLSEEREAELAAELEAELDAALAEADATPPPRPEEIFEHVYAREPQRLARQRRDAQGPGAG